MRRRLVAGLVSLGAVVMPGQVAALMVWTLVASPLTVIEGQSTTYTLTATNLDLLTELGCLEVDLPAAFVIESVGAATATNGDDWIGSATGNSVIVHSESGGGRLETGDSVTFSIRAAATVAGAYTWLNRAHRQQDCSTAEEAGVPIAIVVLAAAATTATATPTPSPSPSPMATPVPTPPLSPTFGATPTPGPSTASSHGSTVSPSPARSDGSSPSPSPTLSPSRQPSSSDAGGSPPSSSSGGGGDRGRLQLVGGRTGSDALGVDVSSVGLSTAGYVWFVPAAAVGIPGLLVVVWVVLQAIGALAWIPAVRRLGDGTGAKPTSS